MSRVRSMKTYNEERIDNAYPIVLDVTPKTYDEHLREIGALGELLVEIIREECGIIGTISLEKHHEGIRVIIKPNNK